MKERELAIFILIDILDEGAYNNIVLRKTLNNHDELSSVQKAFVTELVNGTLRNLINIDYIINNFSSTAVNKMKPFILNNIRLGVYQLLFMDKVPVSAACNEAVKLAKKRGFTNLSGFVNGVLRTIAREKDNIKYPSNSVDYLAIKYSYPKWIIEYWIKELGYDITNQICIANNEVPRISLCVNSAKTNKIELANQLIKEGMTIDCNTLLDKSIYLYKTNNIANAPSYKKGLFHIMDESSLIAVMALNPSEGSTVIDVCAAPGGKSFAISQMVGDSGRVISRDVYEHKIELINKGASRLSLKNITTAVFDAVKIDNETKADYVLVDAPCSGLGLVKKKPDIKYNKSYDDILDLVKIQREILASSQLMVKDSGVLMYTTCTISIKENMENINWFLDNFDFKLEAIELPNTLSYDTAKKGYIQILPSDYGTDGFFIARLRRK